MNREILTAVLCGMPTIRYSARSARLSVHKLFTSCIRRDLVSRDLIVTQSMVIGCLRLSDVSGRCRVVNSRRTSQKIWGVSCTECTFQGNDFELIPTVKMETRNSGEGCFGSTFLSICNQCGVMADWSRKTLKVLRNLCVFWKYDPLAVNFSKFCSESFHRDAEWRVVFKFCKIGRRKISEIVRCWPDNSCSIVLCMIWYLD